MAGTDQAFQVSVTPGRGRYDIAIKHPDLHGPDRSLKVRKVVNQVIEAFDDSDIEKPIYTSGTSVGLQGFFRTIGDLYEWQIEERIRAALEEPAFREEFFSLPAPRQLARVS